MLKCSHFKLQTAERYRTCSFIFSVSWNQKSFDSNFFKPQNLQIKHVFIWSCWMVKGLMLACKPTKTNGSPDRKWRNLGCQVWSISHPVCSHFPKKDFITLCLILIHPSPEPASGPRHDYLILRINASAAVWITGLDEQQFSPVFSSCL